MMKKKPTIHKTKIVASSQLINIEAVDLEFSNGEKRVYERIASRGNGAVLIIPLLVNKSGDEILLIREYCVGTERYELGFPKGKIEAGEAVLHAANREIMEEVGYQAEKLSLLKKLSLAPGYMGHLTHIVLAENLSVRKEEGDEPEALEVVPWKLNKIDALIERDDFAEGRSVAALYLLQHHLQKSS